MSIVDSKFSKSRSTLSSSNRLNGLKLKGLNWYGLYRLTLRRASSLSARAKVKIRDRALMLGWRVIEIIDDEVFQIPARAMLPPPSHVLRCCEA
jgi:hypothetical protein